MPKKAIVREPFYEVYSKQLKEIINDMNKEMTELIRHQKIDKTVLMWNNIIVKYNKLIDEEEEHKQANAS